MVLFPPSLAGNPRGFFPLILLFSEFLYLPICPSSLKGSDFPSVLTFLRDPTRVAGFSVCSDFYLLRWNGDLQTPYIGTHDLNFTENNSFLICKLVIWFLSDKIKLELCFIKDLKRVTYWTFVVK